LVGHDDGDALQMRGKWRVELEKKGLPIYATAGTAEALRTLGIECVLVEKTEGPQNSALALIEAGEVDLVINVPREFDELGRPDGYLIRRCAVDHGVPLLTDLQLARVVIDALRLKRPHELRVPRGTTSS
jgi:carbamoyl-phosphate synthase large subunit